MSFNVSACGHPFDQFSRVNFNQSQEDQKQAAASKDIYSILQVCGEKCAKTTYGNVLYGPLRTCQEGGVNILLMPAEAQTNFDFVEGLKYISRWKGLDENAQVWWIGGDLTGIFLEEQAIQATEALQAFIKHIFLNESGNLRQDRLLISEYAGPEAGNGNGCSAIRCVGRLLEKMPELSSNFLAYGVVTSASWFKSIRAQPHSNINHLYVVHGNRTDSDDAWNSNALARNAMILEGGSRTLGYIFEAIANGGQVVGVYGFRRKTTDYFNEQTGKYYLSAVRFVSELITHLTSHPDANNEDVILFWNQYIQEWKPFNPYASDASTKQKYIDEAWHLFIKAGLIRTIKDHFKGYSYQEFMTQYPLNPLPNFQSERKRSTL